MSSEHESNVPALQRETILPSSDRGRLAAIVATCSLAGLAGGMALSMLAETHRAAMAAREQEAYLRARGGGAITWLGVRISDAVPGHCSGVRVRTVEPRSPAALAGFVRGDLIVSFGGDRVCSDDHLVDVVRASSIGASPHIGILRGGEPMTLQPALANMPSAVRARLSPDQLR